MKLEDYSKYYIQGSDHYLMPKDVFDELFDEMESWKEEAKELKKQLEEFRLDIINGEPYIKLKTVTNQQREFIEYLEHEKDRLARECSQIYEDSLGKTKLVNEDIFSEVDKILSKYKEIIGGINSVSSKNNI